MTNPTPTPAPVVVLSTQQLKERNIHRALRLAQCLDVEAPAVIIANELRLLVRGLWEDAEVKRAVAKAEADELCKSLAEVAGRCEGEWPDGTLCCRRRGKKGLTPHLCIHHSQESLREDAEQEAWEKAHPREMEALVQQAEEDGDRTWRQTDRLRSRLCELGSTWR